MKILITIPHYYNASNEHHGSGGKDPKPRINALQNCLYGIFTNFSNSQCMIDIFNKKVIPVNNNFLHDIDIVICTANGKHLLEHLPVPNNFYVQHELQLENPKCLGFECQKVLKDNIGKYDYYCFMEDDLIIHDTYFFEKINWFNGLTENLNLLQPNRYEVSARGKVLKSYVDGDIRPAVTENYQKVNEFPFLQSNFLGKNINFQRPLNPHSGCFFLSQQQMEYWVNQPHFLDMDVSFISPLESTASLGIMKAFRVYKPAPQNASFLEIQHYGDAFLTLIGKQVSLTEI